MLLLTRTVHEKIVIDGNIEIVICRVNGMQVTIGVKAPEHVSIHREEIFKKVKDVSFAYKNKKSAA